MSRFFNLIYVAATTVIGATALGGVVCLDYLPEMSLPVAVWVVTGAALAAGLLVALLLLAVRKALPANDRASRILWPFTTVAAIACLGASFHFAPESLVRVAVRSLLRQKVEPLKEADKYQASSLPGLVWLANTLEKAEPLLVGETTPRGINGTLKWLNLESYAGKVDEGLITGGYPQPTARKRTITIHYMAGDEAGVKDAHNRLKGLVTALKKQTETGKSELAKKWASSFELLDRSIKPVLLESKLEIDLHKTKEKLEKKLREMQEAIKNRPTGNVEQPTVKANTADWKAMLVKYQQMVREVKTLEQAVRLYSFTAETARLLNVQAELAAKADEFDQFAEVLVEWQREVGSYGLRPASQDTHTLALWEGQREWLLKVIDQILRERKQVNLDFAEQQADPAKKTWTWPEVRARLFKAYPMEMIRKTKITHDGAKKEMLRYIEDRWMAIFELPLAPDSLPMCNPVKHDEDEAVQRATAVILDAVWLLLPWIRDDIQSRHDKASKALEDGSLTWNLVVLSQVGAPFNAHPYWKDKLDELKSVLEALKFEPRYLKPGKDDLRAAGQEGVLMAAKFLAVLKDMIDKKEARDEALAQGAGWFSVFYSGGEGEGFYNPFPTMRQARGGVPRNIDDPKSEPLGALPPLKLDDLRKMQSSKESVKEKPKPPLVNKEVEALRKELHEENKEKKGHTPKEERDAAVKKIVKKKIPDEKQRKLAEDAVQAALKGLPVATQQQAVEQALEEVLKYMQLHRLKVGPNGGGSPG